MTRGLNFAMLLLALAGCATNGYRQFYTPLPGATPEKIEAMRVAPPSSEPKVAHLAGRFDESAQREYAREGYELIGYSSFTGARAPDEDDAADQARKVGADLVVILDAQYSGSVTVAIPITTPTTSTSYTNGTATAYGTGGSAVAFGSSTTTTYGMNTTYIPRTVDRYQYAALYLIKAKFRLGIKMRALSDQERQTLQTNHGVYVMTVVDGTPAYASDILPGDILTAIDGSTIDGQEGLNQLLAARAGTTVEVTVLRQGKSISKAVSLRQ